MNRTVLIMLAALLILLAEPSGSFADNASFMHECEIIIDDFADGIDSGWKHKSFKGETAYTWTSDGDKNSVRAVSKGAASGLYYEIEFDPRKYQYITWQWKVDNILPSGDASKKSGDDYGARIYIVFPSFFFWNTNAVNYIWANRLPKGDSVPNPYTENAVMISVESGSAETGKWLTETRNIYEDFKRAFGQEPPLVGGIAIMTDTDNTGESTSAYYGPIAICSRKPGN